MRKFIEIFEKFCLYKGSNNNKKFPLNVRPAPLIITMQATADKGSLRNRISKTGGNMAQLLEAAKA